MNSHPLFRQYYLDRDFERREIFELIFKQLQVRRALYPGSFVHVTPSFYIPEVVYVDSDKQAQKFFLEDEVNDFIQSNKRYSQPSLYRFHPQNFSKEIPERDDFFDLLISQYAGFVSQIGKRYLRTGGWLLVNNSHGDASMAHLDADYRFLAAISGDQHNPHWIIKNMDTYFIPRRGSHPTMQEVLKTQKGVGYKKTPLNYVFEKI